MAVPPVGAKDSLLKQLQSVRKQTGKTPSQLAAYENAVIPSEFEYLLRYFHDFYNGDQFSYTELQAWQQYAGIKLEYWEAEMIRQLYLERTAFDFKRQQDFIASQKGKK